jgi:hypothetical protein
MACQTSIANNARTDSGAKDEVTQCSADNDGQDVVGLEDDK